MTVGHVDHLGRSFLGWMVKLRSGGNLYFHGDFSSHFPYTGYRSQGLLFQTKIEARMAIQYRLDSGALSLRDIIFVRLFTKARR